MRPGCSPSWPGKRQWINASTHPSPAGDSGKRSCFLPLAACDKQSRRMDRAAVGMQGGEVCVIPSALESHREKTGCSSRASRGPRLPSSLPRARQNTRCAEIGPRCQDGQPCRQALGWGWPGAVEEEAEEAAPHKWAPCAADERSGRRAGQAGQHGAASLFWTRTWYGDTGESGEGPGIRGRRVVRAIEKQLVLYRGDCPLEIIHRIQAGHQGQVQSRPHPAWSRAPHREQKRPPARVQDGEIDAHSIRVRASRTPAQRSGWTAKPAWEGGCEGPASAGGARVTGDQGPQAPGPGPLA